MKIFFIKKSHKIHINLRITKDNINDNFKYINLPLFNIFTFFQLFLLIKILI